MNLPIFTVLLVIPLLFASGVVAGEPDGCITCHAKVVSSWQQSDHAKAMAIVTPQTVLGDFDNTSIQHFTQVATFYRDNDAYKVKLTEDNKSSNYTLTHTFGHYPLQQYLAPYDGGRLQVFPFAWDSRSVEDGGQRWYANNPLEDVKPNDRLHWKQPLQNWNGMCADCHSSGLKRYYNVEDNSFQSEHEAINVGCQSCHGEMQEHSKASSKPIDSGWVLKEGESVASWVGGVRDNGFMDSCFSCHSLRAPLSDGFTSDEKFLDQFSPSFLTPDMYHADGQIKDEVYVYGSFLQSKMFAAGVNCLDCHDTHTLKVKEQTNALCLQCHSPNRYQTEKHTFHAMGSEAGQCVSCHMPETRYMGVDDRRDHSFKIPKPHLSEQYNTPNVCTSCHQEESAAWAEKALSQWFGEAAPVEQGELLYLKLQRDRRLPLRQHFELINDKGLSEIKRATAISMLPLSTQRVSDSQLRHLINSTEPLIRLAVARVGFLLTNDEREKSYPSLLDDEYRAIRSAAANELAGMNLSSSKVFAKAFQELLTAFKTTSWRAEGLLNLSELDLKQGDVQAAIAKLEQAIAVDPFLDASYINLAELYRSQRKFSERDQIVSAGLQANPKSSMLHYVKGLSLISASREDIFVQAFAKAVELDTSNPQFAYAYFLALDKVGETAVALQKLRTVIARYSGDKRLGKLGLILATKMQNKPDLEFFNHYLSQQ